eukprot:1148296-Pelagomonas_calceolata.AAC.1
MGGHVELCCQHGNAIIGARVGEPPAQHRQFSGDDDAGGASATQRQRRFDDRVRKILQGKAVIGRGAEFFAASMVKQQQGFFAQTSCNGSKGRAPVRSRFSGREFRRAKLLEAKV